MVTVEQPDYLHKIADSLEKQSWYSCESFIKADVCRGIYEYLIQNRDDLDLKRAAIGKGPNRIIHNAIRQSFVSWIDDWNQPEQLHLIQGVFHELMTSLNRYFFLSMKRFESQFAIYERGDFYKLHLDQHKKTRHRQITCTIYLNDCEEGGELVLYEKHSKSKVAHVIHPKRGSVAIFFSGHIYHEVKPTLQPRYSITTWFRDDALLPFQSLYQ